MPATHRPTLRRVAALTLAATALLLSLFVPAPTAAAVEPGEEVAPHIAALDWLAAEIVASDGVLTVTDGEDTYPDQGLTLDALLALAAGGRGDDPAVAVARDGLSSQMTDYLTGYAGGTARAAGALAKTLLTEEAVGEDVSPGFDLEPELRALMDVEGDHAGRFRDKEGWGDFSNGLGQALAVLALAGTDAGVPAAALDYLLAQQCADGSFRLYYDPGASCADPAEGDPDATAVALVALLAVPGDGAVPTARDAAVAHLAGLQGADGGISGTGAVNANTTGLAGGALRAAGQTAAADAAAGFVRSVQWTGSCADLGAVAYDAAALDASTAAGALQDRSQWVRATAQGVLALGLSALGTAGAPTVAPAGLAPLACSAPTPPATPTTAPPVPTLVLSSGASVLVGGLLEGTADGFEPGELVVATLHSTPRTLGRLTAAADGSVAFSLPVPADLEPGVHRLVLTGETSGRSVSAEVEVTAPSSPRTLPAAGVGSVGLAGVGAALVALGVGLRRAGDRRHQAHRRVHGSEPVGPSGVTAGA